MDWRLKVERREAQRPTSLGARGLKGAARGGSVNPASKGCVAHTPGASRRSIALARFARVTCKPRTHCAARIRKRGCLKLWIGNQTETLQRTSRHARA